MYNALIRAFALFALVVMALLPGCSCGSGGGMICTGGGRLVGNGCFCPRGTTWGGNQCQGTPEQGVCTQKGAMEVVGAAGSICTCPDGWIWSSPAMEECVACTGGAIASGDSCVCPDGTAWDGNQCQAQAPVAQEQPQEAPQQQAPAQVEVQQRTIQSTQSFTCCVNHARYQCPNQAAFTACATLSPNHGCARAGGC